MSKVGKEGHVADTDADRGSAGQNRPTYRRVRGHTKARVRGQRRLRRVAYADEGGEPGSDLDAVREEYAADLTTLTSLEEKEVDELRGRLLELERTIGTRETEFKRSFTSFDREWVESEQGAPVEDADRPRRRHGDPALLHNGDPGLRRTRRIREHREAATQSPVPIDGAHPRRTRTDPGPHRPRANRGGHARIRRRIGSLARLAREASAGL